MKQRPQIWIFCLILLGLCYGCRSIPPEPISSRGGDRGFNETDQLSKRTIPLRIEPEPVNPVTVPLKVSQESGETEVKVAIKPSAESLQPIAVPVQIQPSATAASALKVPIAIQPEAGETKTITVPFELKLNDEKKPISVPFELKLAGGTKEGGETKPITVPIDLKLGGDAKEGGQAKTITLPIDLKLGGDGKRELEIQIKPVIDVPKSIEIPMTIKPTFEGPRTGGVVSFFLGVWYVFLGIFMIFLGGVGGVLKSYFAATDFELAHKIEDKRFLEFVFAERASIVYGMAAAALMPFLLYLVRGDVFTREGALVWIVLGSACLGGGFLGAGLLRQFDRVVLTAFGRGNE